MRAAAGLGGGERRLAQRVACLRHQRNQECIVRGFAADPGLFELDLRRAVDPRGALPLRDERRQARRDVECGATRRLRPDLLRDGQGFEQNRARPLAGPAADRHHRDVEQVDGDIGADPLLAIERERFLVERLRRIQVALGAIELGQHGKRLLEAADLAQLPRQRQRLLEVTPCVGAILARERNRTEERERRDDPIPVPDLARDRQPLVLAGLRLRVASREIAEVRGGVECLAP